MQTGSSKKILIACGYLSILVGLYMVRLHSYLLFHSIVEMFSVCVAFAIFMIVWNSRHFMQNDYLLFIGIAYLFVGGFDLIYMLAYPGMTVFRGYGTNLSNQLWVSARYMESLSLLIAPLFLRRRLKVNVIVPVYVSMFSILILSIFHFGIFPACFNEKTGLTQFCEASDFVIIGTLFISLILLLRERGKFDPKVLHFVSGSIGFTMLSELMSTMYTRPYEAADMIGHLLKFISFYLIYKALIETGLKEPYNLLFRELKQSEQELKVARDKLETRVQHRTAELAQSEKRLLAHQEQLRDLTAELQVAEEAERRKLALELHDSVGQILAFLKIELGDLPRVGLSKESANVVRHIREQVDRAIKQTRTLTFEMSPPELYTLGLGPAIEELAQRFGESRNLNCSVEECDNPTSLTEYEKVLLYRSVRELLINTAKHAQASVVEINICESDNELRISVEDDGVGFDVDRLDKTLNYKHKGFGLFSIRERLQHIGGRLDIHSRNGKGTRIKLYAPLENKKKIYIRSQEDER